MTSLNGANIEIGPTQAIKLETTKPSTKLFVYLPAVLSSLYVLDFNHSPIDSSFFSI